MQKPWQDGPDALETDPWMGAPGTTSAAEASPVTFWTETDVISQQSHSRQGIVPHYLHSSRDKSDTWRALILVWTFSWDSTLEGSGSTETSSATKMLSWDNALDPSVTSEHLSSGGPWNQNQNQL